MRTWLSIVFILINIGNSYAKSNDFQIGVDTVLLKERVQFLKYIPINKKEVLISNAYCKKINIDSGEQAKINIADCIIDTLRINSASFKSVNIKDCLIRNLLLVGGNEQEHFELGSKIDGDAGISGCVIYKSTFRLSCNSLHVYNTVFYSTTILTVFVNSLRFSVCKFDYGFMFYECSFNELAFAGVEFVGIPYFRNSALPNSILLSHLKFKDNRKLDLTQLINSAHKSDIDKRSDKGYTVCGLYAENIDWSKIKMNYKNFILLFRKADDAAPTSLVDTTDIKNSTYLALLDHQKASGNIKGFRKLDLEYQKFYYCEADPNKIIYFTKKLWNNFGYDKWHIFAISGILFFLLAIINTKFVYFLLDNVYVLPKMKAQIDEEPKALLMRRFTFSLFYTGIIFFGLKLDVDNMHFKYNKYVFYILSIYTMGLICTAFMFNYFVSN